MPTTERHNISILGHYLYSIVEAESRLRFIPLSYLHTVEGNIIFQTLSSQIIGLN